MCATINVNNECHRISLLIETIANRFKSGIFFYNKSGATFVWDFIKKTYILANYWDLFVFLFEKKVKKNADCYTFNRHFFFSDAPDMFLFMV